MTTWEGPPASTIADAHALTLGGFLVEVCAAHADREALVFDDPLRASSREGVTVRWTYTDLERSELDLVVSGTRDAIMMVEAGAKLLPEDVMAEAILFGHRAIQPLIDLQEELQKAVGKAKRLPYIEPSAQSVLDFVQAARDGREFAVIEAGQFAKVPVEVPVVLQEAYDSEQHGLSLLSDAF